MKTNRKIWLAVAALMLCLGIQAQERSSSTFGLDPKDAKAVRDIQRRMAQIRQHRPTVALVLSGGGAKGAATVGALRYMEEYDLPVDMVLGTSIGGLLGGMYSLGYSAGYLDTLIHSINWDMALSDKVERKFIPSARIRYKEKYLISIPFYYRSEDYQDYVTGSLPFDTHTDRTLHLGADGGFSLDRLISENLLGSLPSGIVYGQNVSQIISTRTVGYSDSTDFFKFPIPFACVATDLASGKAKVWHEGSVNLALRSTMSIPGLFTPVRTQGMVLTDGGMRNNFPVDIARDMGADIVIGIDLSTASVEPDRINNLGDILWQGVDMLSNDAYERNVRSVDVLIHPDLHDYNMLSFNDEAIDTMYWRGYRAAQAASSQLASVRKKVGQAKSKLNARPAIDLNSRPVVIGDIDIVGVTPDEADYIRSKMSVKPGSLVSHKEIGEDISRIFGEGIYDYVNYELRGSMEPYRLRILCKRGPLHQLGLGFRVDSQDLVSILINLGFNTHAIRGSSLDMTARIGVNPYVDFRYSYNAPKIPTINARARFRWTDHNYILSDDNSFNISYLVASQDIFLSNMKWSAFDVQGGVRNQLFKIRKVLASSHVDFDPGSLVQGTQDYPSLFLNARLQTLDDGYFPTRGLSIGMGAEAVGRFFDDNEEVSKVFGSFSFDGLVPVSWGRFTLLPQWNMRYLLGDSIPLVYANLIGGDFPGRYIDHQIPFIGVNNAAFQDNFLTIGRLDARFRVGGSHYVTAMFNTSYDFHEFARIAEGSFHYGAGLSYAYNSVAGPLKFTLHWSSFTRKLGWYLSLGYNF